jgi:NAD(P)-dependent dehydrogenase (short-subunit alcohol dehydrogenase family)
MRGEYPTSKSWSFADISNQEGRTAIVTGGNSGIGFEISRALAAKGARVVLACRNSRMAESAAQRIRELTPDSKIETVELDLASLESVSSAADQIVARYPQLNLLVNNAGLMAVDFKRTVDGFETQIGVNHLGHFALTLRLLPILSKTDESRVVTMSSIGHRSGKIDLIDLNYEHRKYRRWEAYFQSKLANLLFTSELNKRLNSQNAGVKALSAHPGVARTDLGTEGSSLSNRLLSPNNPLVSQSAASGALPALRASTDPTAGGGDYYGPRWYFRGYPVLETPSHTARNLTLASQFWGLSESLTNLKY